MLSTRLARAATVLVAVSFAGPGAADDPPGGTVFLAANAYSGTAGGVRWERATDDRGVRGYELTRDGRVLGVFDALSYVDRDLGPGLVYRYGVTPVDTAGQRATSSAFVMLRTPGDGDGTAAGPRPPAGLRATAYSGTAGAISWTRSATPGLRYDVSRDGEPLLSGTDHLSYVDTTLAPGGDYVYEVVAVRPDARRSEPARVTLSTPGESGEPVVVPGAPANARLERYSTTAAELFWERPPAAERVRSTEVLRDGAPLGTAEGNSFFDDTLEPGRRHVYELTAIGADGARSPTTRVVAPADTGSGPGGTTDAPTALLARLDVLFAIANGDALEIAQAVRANALRAGNSRFEREYGDPQRPNVTIGEFRCEGGGTARATLTATIGSERLLDLVLDGCRFGAVTVSGRFDDRTLPGRTGIPVPPSYVGVESGRSYAIEDFRLTDERDARTIALSGYSRQGVVGDDYRRFTASWGAASMVLEAAGERREVESLATETRFERTDDGEPFTATLRTSFVARLDGAAGTTRVTTPTPFVRPVDGVGEYASGVLSVIGPDYRYELDADNGDPASFRLDASVGEAGAESVVSYAIPWSAVRGFDVFDTAGVDLGD